MTTYYNVFVYDEDQQYIGCAGQFTEYEAARRCRDRAYREGTFGDYYLVIESYEEYEDVLRG